MQGGDRLLRPSLYSHRKCSRNGESWRWSIETCRPPHLLMITQICLHTLHRFFWKMFFWTRLTTQKSKKLNMDHSNPSKAGRNLRRRNADAEIQLSIVSLLREAVPIQIGLLTVTQPLLYHIAIFIVSVFNCWTKRSCESRCVAPSAWKSYWPSLPSLFAQTLVSTLDRLDNA